MFKHRFPGTGFVIHACRHSHLCAGLLVVTLSAAASAASFDEAVSGEFSADRLAPARLLLDATTPGPLSGVLNNVVTGTVGRSTSGLVDRDYLNVVVPAGFAWTELRVGNQTTVGGSGSFVGLAAGSTMPVPPDASNAAGLLGWKLYALSDRGTDILDELETAANGSSGFDRPLGPGDYTLWIQELATGTFTYRLNLVLTPIPEAGTAPLVVVGLAGIGIAVLRRRAQGEASKVA